jgi:hypothetical protein
MVQVLGISAWLVAGKSTPAARQDPGKSAHPTFMNEHSFIYRLAISMSSQKSALFESRLLIKKTNNSLYYVLVCADDVIIVNIF